MANPVTYTELATALKAQYMAALTSPQFFAISVTHPDGSSVTYRDLDQLRRALGQAEILAKGEQPSGRGLFMGCVPA